MQISISNAIGGGGGAQGSGGGSSFASTNSFTFDGSSDYVYVPNSTSLNITTAMSVSAWFKTTSSSVMYLLTQGSGSQIKYFVQFYAPINRIRLGIYDGSDLAYFIYNFILQ